MCSLLYAFNVNSGSDLITVPFQEIAYRREYQPTVGLDRFQVLTRDERFLRSSIV